MSNTVWKKAFKSHAVPSLLLSFLSSTSFLSNVPIKYTYGLKIILNKLTFVNEMESYVAKYSLPTSAHTRLTFKTTNFSFI